MQHTTDLNATRVAWNDETLIPDLYQFSLHNVEQAKALAQGKIPKKDKRLREHKVLRSTASECSSEGQPRKQLRTEEEPLNPGSAHSLRERMIIMSKLIVNNLTINGQKYCHTPRIVVQGSLTMQSNRFSTCIAVNIRTHI